MKYTKKQTGRGDKVRDKFAEKMIDAYKNNLFEDFYRKHRFRFLLRSVWISLEDVLYIILILIGLLAILFCVCFTCVVIAYCVQQEISPWTLFQILSEI